MLDDVCLCCGWTRDYCARTGNEGDICFKASRSSGGWTKLHSEELHGLCWAVNGGGWWTERECGRWDKRNWLEKLKTQTKFQLETLKGRGPLGDLGLDEMLKTMWWNAHKALQFQLPSPQQNIKSSLVISVLLMEQTSHWRLRFVKDFQNCTEL